MIYWENYSQIRLTGHDFLDIGTGDFTDTNYPTLYTEGYNFGAGEEPKQFNEVVEAGGGRVFYTSTDQDGNFRAGEQFLVEQATGIITLNSSLFNFTGLQSLTLGGVVLGGTAVVITEFSKEQSLIFICGHYKDIDQRVIDKYVTNEYSIGDFVLTGGELPTCLIVDSIVRLIPGVLNNYESAESDSFFSDLLDGPHYTRPENYRGLDVPNILLSGHHDKIAQWQNKMREEKTKKIRPDIWKKYKK